MPKKVKLEVYEPAKIFECQLLAVRRSNTRLECLGVWEATRNCIPSPYLRAIIVTSIRYRLTELGLSNLEFYANK